MNPLSMNGYTWNVSTNCIVTCQYIQLPLNYNLQINFIEINPNLIPRIEINFTSFQTIRFILLSYWISSNMLDRLNLDIERKFTSTFHFFFFFFPFKLYYSVRKLFIYDRRYIQAICEDFCQIKWKRKISKYIILQ